MFAFQTIKIEANNNSMPTVTPNPRIIKKKPKQAIEVENDETHRTRKPKINKPQGFQEISGIGMEVNSRSKNPRRKSVQYNPKEVGIDKIKSKKPTNFTSAEGRSMSFELRRKQPRKRIIFDDTSGSESVTRRKQTRKKRH